MGSLAPVCFQHLDSPEDVYSRPQLCLSLSIHLALLCQASGQDSCAQRKGALDRIRPQASCQQQGSQGSEGQGSSSTANEKEGCCSGSGWGSIAAAAPSRQQQHLRALGLGLG